MWTTASQRRLRPETGWKIEDRVLLCLRRSLGPVRNALWQAINPFDDDPCSMISIIDNMLIPKGFSS
jgi:hypothetical protein